MPYKDPQNPKNVARLRAYYYKTKELLREARKGAKRKYRKSQKGKQWTATQWRLKKEARQVYIDKIKQIIIDENIGEKDTVGYIAMVVFFVMVAGLAHTSFGLSVKTGYDKKIIKGILKNWQASYIWDGKRFHLEEPIDNIIQLSLISLCGEGVICAIQADEPAINNDNARIISEATPKDEYDNIELEKIIVNK